MQFQCDQCYFRKHYERFSLNTRIKKYSFVFFFFPKDFINLTRRNKFVSYFFICLLFANFVMRVQIQYKLMSIRSNSYFEFCFLKINNVNYGFQSKSSIDGIYKSFSFLKLMSCFEKKKIKIQTKKKKEKKRPKSNTRRMTFIFHRKRITV